MDLEPGTQLGKYEITGRLGAGGMGVVHEARDSRLDRQVAIKFLPADLQSAAAARRFEQEARAVSSLDHPHILTVFDVGEHDGHPYLVTELVPGGTLRDWLQEETRSWRQVVSLLVGVADGLAAAHSSGILHRDLKPDNILVDGSGYARLADFGLAKRIDSTAGQTPDTMSPTATMERAVTDPGRIVGTIAYMSPEQTRGRSLDARSDVFSFGALLYEAFSREPAFAGDSDLEVLAGIRERSPRPLPAGLPAPLREVVEKALEKDPAERYQAMPDLVVDLKRVLRLTHQSGRADAGSPPAAKRGSPLLLGMALVVIAALGAGLWFTRPEPVPANPLATARITPITDFPGDEFDANISPDGRYVLFVSDRGGRQDYWLAPTAGRGRFQNLTREMEWEAYAPGGIRALGFNSDGSEVILHCNPPPDESLQLLSFPVGTGGDPRPLFADNAAAEVAYALDGRMVYHAPAPGDPLYVLEPTVGATPRLLHRARDGVHQHTLRWGLDDKWIYMTRGEPQVGNMNLWRVSAEDGSDLEQLTYEFRDVLYPAPIDDRTIMFVARDSDGAGPWLWAHDLATGVSSRSSLGVESYLSVASSADGRKLVVTRANPRARLWTVPILADAVATEEDAGPVEGELETVRALGPRSAGESLFFLSSRGARDGLWRQAGDGRISEVLSGAQHALRGSAAASQDGRRVSVCVDQGDRRLLMVIEAPFTRPRPVCPEIDVQGAGSWSPDGRSLVVGGRGPEGRGLFRVDVDANSFERIVDGSGSSPEWSPRGDLIVYAGIQSDGPHMPLLAVGPDGSERDLPGELEIVRYADRYRFLPDGSGLVFLMRPVARIRGEFWLLDLESGETRQLTRLSRQDEMQSFDITPDGKTIIFDRLTKNADIALIDLDPKD